ncbi:MAG: TonB-dependent receptor [bacterium]|nr:TonB-dependent receptor [Candidatus Kapabacteria bacterium]
MHKQRWGATHGVASHRSLMKRVVYIAVTMCAAASALAQNPDSTAARRGEDSARAVSLPSVIVQAQSIATQSSTAAHSTTILARAAIDAAQARDASDVVALAPGAFIRQYGGQGGLRTVSLRGTSAQQTVVLLDGVRYQSSAVGSVDLGSIPSSILKRVEVVRGGDAARFGANALGGAVNLITGSDAANGDVVSMRADAGSFGEIGASASAATRYDRGSIDASISLTSSNGSFPFSYREYGETSIVRRRNADASRFFARASWEHNVDTSHRLGVTLLGFESDRGVPGAIVQGQHEQLNARMSERELFAIARSSWSVSSWQMLVALTGRVNDLTYRDPDDRSLRAEGTDSRYVRNESALFVRTIYPITERGIFEASAELSYADLEGDNLDPSAGGTVERLQGGVTTATSWIFSNASNGNSVAFDAALRIDAYSTITTALSPSLGVSFQPLGGPLRLRARGTMNYRVPSFTEQYYLNYGNTALRPERSYSVDAGATFLVDEALVLEASGFLIDTRDQIVAVPQSPLVWSARNVARTLSRGIELGVSGTMFDGMLATNLSYTRMHAEDRTGDSFGKLLIYTPEEFATALVEFRYDVFALGATWQHVSHRHTLTSNAADAALPHYETLNAHMSARATIAGINCTARIEGFNLFDAEYQVIRNYPMPGRSLRLGVEAAYALR